MAGLRDEMDFGWFYLVIDGRILPHDSLASLASLGIRKGCIIRVWARLRGGRGEGGFRGFGEWMCCNPTCRVTKCWPTRKSCCMCGAPSHSHQPQPRNESGEGAQPSRQRKPQQGPMPPSATFSRNNGGKPGQGHGAFF